MRALPRRSLLLSGAVGLVAGTGPPCLARAQGARSWPQRPVRLLVPYAPPGGGTDVFARALAEGLRPILGQPVLVENRAGANGVVGSEVVSRAEPDGHSFLVDTGSHTLNPYVMPSLPYQTARDFAPVALLSRFPMLLAAGAATPYTTVAELIAAALHHRGGADRRGARRRGASASAPPTPRSPTRATSSPASPGSRWWRSPTAAPRRC